MSEEYFFDEARIYVKAGDGGDGAVAFRREKYEPFGGPAGGHGGRGGDVIIYADPALNTLLPFKRRQHFKAGAGGHGGGNKKRGADGADERIAVPVGTVVHDAETGQVLADLTQPGQEVVVARGGRGGRGNSAFATPTNQAPRFAEKGEPGEERWLFLELKLIADVGIIGMPNAGKSTLLSVISAARPKIANYPFTTLSPNLGVVSVGYRDFVVADIPGLIEGAHEGIGLGDKFLRHVERTRLLIHLLDGASQDPLNDFDAINRELALYSRRLAEKPQLVVLNKIDLPDARAIWPLIQDEMAQRGLPAMAISAVTQENVREMLTRIVAMLDELPRERESVVEELPVLRPTDTDDAFRLFRRGRRETPDQPLTWRIEGKRVERIAAMTDWNNDEAIARFQRQLRALGVIEALERAGVQDGDTVIIGEVELEWSQGGEEGEWE
ncbi:MAG: GTPase ObgE [Chloroflexi bacterium]|nr:MAG: GTPase ObgE [Chloroflexota bacterium]